MNEPRDPVRIEQFKGLISNADPSDIPPNACSEQSNIQACTPGYLSVRKGCRVATFGNNQAALASNIQAMVHYNTANADYIIYQLANGTVRVGRAMT